jgi:large repetitive protein
VASKIATRSAPAPRGGGVDEQLFYHRRVRSLVATALVLAGCSAGGDPPAPQTREPRALSLTGPRLTAHVADGGAVRVVARGGAVVLETAAIGRGVGTAWPVFERAEEAGSVLLDRGVAVESFAPTERGIEQSWRFAAAPAGEGDLEVVVALHGAHVERVAGAFVLDGRFRYGAATWVDATGARAPLTTTLDDDRVVITVPEGVLEASRYPAVLDPEVVAMADLDDAPVYGAAPLPQWTAEIAGDGLEALAVWRDDREAAEPGATAAVFATYGTALGSLGTPLQPANVRITPPGAFDQQVVYLDTDAMTGVRKLVVVWSTQFDVHATHVEMGSAGELTVLPDKVIHTPAPTHFARVIAAAGGPGHYLVTFTEGPVGNVDAFAMLLDDDSDPLVAPTFLGDSSSIGRAGAATYAASAYIFLNRSDDGTPLVARVLDATLATLASFTVTISDNEPVEPGLAYNGTTALAVWEDHRIAARRVYTRRLDQTGVLGAELPIAGFTAAQFAPAVAPGDAAQDEFLLAWLEDGPIEGELAGGVLHANDSVTAAQSGFVARRPAVANLSDDAYVAFDDGDNQPLLDTTNVFGARYASGWPASPALLSREANLQSRVAVDARGTQALAAWSDTRAGRDDSDIFAVVTDDAGAPVGGVLRLSSHALIEDDVDVAAGDDAWIAVWRRGDDTPSSSTATSIEAALLDAQGAVIDTLTLAPAGVNQHPRVVFDGSDYLVTWERGTFTCEAFCQYFPADPTLVRLRSVGASLTQADSYGTSEAGYAPFVARDPAGGALWLWEHAGDVHAARVPTNGAPGATVVVTAADGRQTRPAAAVHAGDALVVWEDDRNGGEEIFGALLRADDSVDALLAAVSGDIAATEPEVVDAGDGYSFLVAWDGSAFAAPRQVWGAFVKHGGTLVDPNARQLTAPSLVPSRRPDVTALSSGRALVAFDAVGPERSPRARTLVLDSGLADGSTCDGADECASRFCADGVCCREACDARCQRCGDDGACGQVVNDFDDACFGTEMCDAEGFCRRTLGESCGAGGDCASGFCVDGVCCETACNGRCDRCNAAGLVGQCQEQSCFPYLCGPDKSCPMGCVESRDCVDDFQCVAGKCQTPVDVRVVDPGCGCRAAGAPERAGASLLLVLLAALALRRRDVRAER